MNEPSVTREGWGRKLRRQFVAGILVVIPLGASILILVWVFNSIDNILQPVIRAIWHHDIPGVGFGATIVLTYLAGVVATNVLGKRIIHYADSLLTKVPVFRQIYLGIKQIVESFANPNKTGFMQVVLVEFPREGMRAVGFITNEVTDASGEKMLSVLIPTAPNPTSGFLQILREEDIIRTNISVDDALKMVVSAGRMTPQEIQAKMP
jgi:uncharacterized membrane protein